MQELVYRIGNDIGSLSVGEKLLGGILITLFSMLMVFSVLLLLMYLIKGMGLVFADRKPEEEKIQEIQVQEEEQLLDENEVMAAIVAAISSMKTSEGSKIVIRQLVKNENNWADAGLLEQINSRL